MCLGRIISVSSPPKNSGVSLEKSCHANQRQSSTRSMTTPYVSDTQPRRGINERLAEYFREAALADSERRGTYSKMDTSAGYWVRFIYGGSRNMPFFPFITVQITHPMDVYHASMCRVPHCEGDILYTTRAYKYIRTSRFAKYVHDEKRRWNRKRI